MAVFSFEGGEYEEGKSVKNKKRRIEPVFFCFSFYRTKYHQRSVAAKDLLVPFMA